MGNGEKMQKGNSFLFTCRAEVMPIHNSLFWGIAQFQHYPKVALKIDRGSKSSPTKADGAAAPSWQPRSDPVDDNVDALHQTSTAAAASAPLAPQTKEKAKSMLNLQFSLGPGTLHGESVTLFGYGSQSLGRLRSPLLTPTLQQS